MEWEYFESFMLAIFYVQGPARFGGTVNPNITMYQGTGKIASLYRGIVINESNIGEKQSQLSLYRG